MHALFLLLTLIPAPHPAPAVPEPPAKEAPAEDGPGAKLTADTQCFLDGRPCKFADVPPGAKVVGLSVAADKRTILIIRFETKK